MDEVVRFLAFFQKVEDIKKKIDEVRQKTAQKPPETPPATQPQDPGEPPGQPSSPR